MTPDASSHRISLTPIRKPTRRLVVRPSRVLVADIGGEETEKAFRRFFIRQKQGGEPFG
jgi:hypothetical protein